MVFRGFETPPTVVHPRAEFIDENDSVVRPDTDRMLATSNHSWVRAFQTLQAMRTGDLDRRGLGLSPALLEDCSFKSSPIPK